MKVDRLFFTVLAVPLDFFAVVAAGMLTWTLRFSATFQAIRPVLFASTLSFSEYLVAVFVSAAATVVIAAILGLYRFPRPDLSAFGVGARLFVATSAVLAGIALTFFFRQELFASRFLVLGGWILATLFLVGERSVVAVIESYLGRRFGFGLRRALVIGSDAVADRVAHALAQRPSFGLTIVKRLREPDVAEVRAMFGNPGVEAIVLAGSNYPREKVLELIDFAHEKHLAFLFVPNLFQSLTANASVGVLGDVPVVELRRTALDGWGKVLKRAVDIIGSLVAILCFAPLMMAIAAAIKITDPEGPVIYRNLRAGERGKPFATLKFRSMYWKYSTGPDAPNPEEALRFEQELAKKQSVRRGPVWKILNDPRRTPIGRFLERTSLDELPQFFNVLRGDMSLVGPRPHMLEQVASYGKGHRRVFAIKPGITGLAQISGRSDLDFDDEVRLDTYYMEHWSPWLDLRIMLKTPWVVLLRRHRS